MSLDFDVDGTLPDILGDIKHAVGVRFAEGFEQHFGFAVDPDDPTVDFAKRVTDELRDYPAAADNPETGFDVVIDYLSWDDINELENMEIVNDLKVQADYISHWRDVLNQLFD